MTLGEKIQKLRKQRGLSQEALAEKVTVTRQTISKWELGQSLPDLDFIAQLSDIFSVSSDYLIKDEMTEPDELPYTIVGAAAEHGSGMTLDRPALQEVMEAVLAGKVDVVLISSLDRIGRDWGMTKQYIALLTEHKVKLLCVRERMMIDSSSFSPFFT